MRRYRWLLITILSVVVVAVVATLALMFPVRKQGQARVEAEAGLPLLLIPETYSDPVGVGEMRLEPDGVAQLTDFPVGDVDVVDNCIDWDSAKPLTGTAEWSADRKLNITITSEDGSVVIGPYHPKFSDIVWYRFGMSLCDDDRVVWYSAAPATP